MNNVPGAAASPDFERLLEASLRAARTVAGMDVGMAEDAAQDAMISYLASEGIEDPEAWCAQVAKRAVIDRLRGDKGLRRRQRVNRWASLGEAAAAERMVDEVHRMRSPSEEVVERSVLADALDSLDDLSRQVLILQVIEGRPADEVGEILGLTRDAVYQRVHRAKATLAERLASSDTTLE